MDEHIACHYLASLGYEVSNGIVTSGNSRYGKVTSRLIKLENGGGSIPLDDVDCISSVDEGHNGKTLFLVRKDGSEVPVPRAEMPACVGDTRLPHGRDGTPLMPRSLSDVRDTWFAAFPDFLGQCWSIRRPQMPCGVRMYKSIPDSAISNGLSKGG